MPANLPPMSLRDNPGMNHVYLDWMRRVEQMLGFSYDPFESLLSSNKLQVTESGGFISSDGSPGITTTVTTGSLVGKTITIKDGIITDFS